jgi:hypothetical protein
VCVFLLQNRERSSYGGNRPMREDSVARKYTLMKEAAFFLRNVGTYLIRLHGVKFQKTVIV